MILPIHPWGEGQKTWQRAEELGFHAAYTYDHLLWRTLRDKPWFGAVPTLPVAAAVTETHPSLHTRDLSQARSCITG